MNRQPIAGPSGTAHWVVRQAGTLDRSLPLLVLPDAANPQRADAGLPNLYYALPQIPQVARDNLGRPVLSLSLVLGGRPGPGDDSIFGLIQSGSLTCDLTLALSDDLQSDTLLPLYARQATFQLLQRTDATHTTALDETTGSGAGVRVGLAAHLDQAAAQGVLIALQRGESGLSLTCQVTYRTAESRLVIHLHARWAAVYDYLYAHMDRSGSFSRAMLQGHLLEMVRTGVLKAWRVEPSGLETDLTGAEAPALLNAFMRVSGILLQSATPNLDPADPGNCYELRARPDEAFGLDMRLSVTTANEACKHLDAPLEVVIGGVLEGLDAENFIHLSYVDPSSGGGTQPVPRRLRSGPPTRGGPDGGAPTLTGLAMVDGDVMSMTRALTPDSTLRPAAHTLLASDVVRPQAGPEHVVVVDHAVLGNIHAEVVVPPRPHLPTVINRNEALWMDYADSSRWWYPPEFNLAPADPAANPDASTFLFTFHETGHDSTGHPVLEGEVLFTLQRGISAATHARLQAMGNPPAQPVPTNGLSVTLSLPVRDGSGQLRQIDLPARVNDNGALVTARVALLNEYVRVAYGDLAIAGFQPNPVQLQVAYTFDAMLHSRFPLEASLPLQFVEKRALTPVAYSTLQAADLGERAYVDATQISYRSAAADLNFRREPPSQASGDGMTARPARATIAAAHPIATAQPALTTMVVARPVQVATAIRPELETDIRLQNLVNPQVNPNLYFQGTIGRSGSVNAFFACTTFGAFYRQDLGDRVTSIGCQDSFSLGQTAFKLYELADEPALASPLYKVYRSLCQPGHFLVLPAAYRITRYAPGEGARAYRPVIYLYSSLDAGNATNNRCVVMASLQPDLPPWARKDLEVKLARLHHSPVTQYVTEIDSELTYSWSLSGGPAAIQPQAAKLWDNFQVTLATDLAGGLQLQAMLAHSGISAQVSFKLADGTTLSTNLILDLTGLTGPWDGGPLETVLQGARVTLTNRIERGVNVSDVVVYAADGSTQAVRVDRLLTTGASVTVALPFTAAAAYPVYTLQAGGPADLTEIPSFVENIHTNVVFVNLINYANHSLKRLDLRVRLKEVPSSETGVPLSEEQPVSEAAFVLPLTTYLSAHTIQFQVTKTPTAGNGATTAWLEWDLTTRGNVISLTWELIQ